MTAKTGSRISNGGSRALDPSERFSTRVADYVRFRPSYPLELFETLVAECGLGPNSVIADVGAGTGIFTRLLLECGNPVFAVEPNDEMRRAAEQSLANYPKVVALKGTAEATGLADHSVDFITCAQSAHWFDRSRTQSEFRRILRAGGWLVLVWNERLTGPDAFLVAYEQLLLAYGTDYQTVRHDRLQGSVREFFDPYPYCEREFGMSQELDYQALEGRLKSSSYTPEADHVNYRPMLDRLRQIFHAYERGGRVQLQYRTRMYYGRLS
jgi:SAM-dependent methyltransferase